MNSDIIVATLGVFLWEIYWNFVWWGSLVTQIALQNIIWMPIKEAMALDNAAVIGSNVGMFIMLLRSNKFVWWMIPFTLFQILWAFLWVVLLLWIPVIALKIIFISAIILLVIKNFFFSSSSEKKEKWFIPTNKNIFLLCLFWIFIWWYNAAFVIWDWIIALLILTSVFHFRYNKAIWLLIVSMCVAQPFATFWYIQNDLVDFSYLIPMICATLFAWLIVGYFLEKIDSKVLEKFLKYLSVFLVIYLIWWIF